MPEFTRHIAYSLDTLPRSAFKSGRSSLSVALRIAIGFKRFTAPPGNTPGPNWPAAACFPTGPVARRGPQSFYLRPGELNSPGLRASGASRLRRVPPRQAAGKAGKHPWLTAPPGNTPGPNWPAAACLPTGPSARRGPRSFFAAGGSEFPRPARLRRVPPAAGPSAPSSRESG